MKKKLQPVEGSADEDMKEIEEADQIRLRAISTIQSLQNARTPHRRRILLFLQNSSVHFSLADRTVSGTLFKTLSSALDTL